MKIKGIKRAGFPTKIIVLILLVYMAVSLLALQEQISDAQTQTATLSQQVEEQKEKNQNLEHGIAQGDDPDMLEEIARSQLGLVVPGEKVFIDISN